MPTMSWIDIIFAAIVSSGIGGLVGGLVAWGGIRIRLDHLEKKVACLSTSVVYKDVCAQCQMGSNEREKRVEKDISEIKKDLKAILNRSFKTREGDKQ